MPLSEKEESQGANTMKFSKEIAIGVLASTLSLGGLAFGVTGCASKQPTKDTAAQKGADHQCGAEGNEGGESGEGANTDSDKGALASCGAGSCG